MPEITYIPLNEGDPHRTVWNGHVFHANVPREVSDKLILERAPGNPCFHVTTPDEPPPAAIVAGAERSKGGRPPKPKTPEEYRAHATRWLNKVAPDPTARDPERAMEVTAAEAQRRWDEEADLRASCGVGSDDLDLLLPILNARFAALGTQMKRSEIGLSL